MLRLGAYRSLYVAFDRYPSRKGAATHIEHASAALAQEASPCLLLTLGDETQMEFEHGAGGAPDILRFRASIPSFLKRVEAFAREVSDVVDELAGHLRICQFRDPWGGWPICSRPNRSYLTVYEVNGLPSVELPYRFPRLASGTLARIARTEDFCLEKADCIVAPSSIIRARLIRQGVSAEKIHWVPNGAAIPVPAPRAEAAPARYILYFGAVQPWQGIPILLRAFAQIADLTDLHLVICSSVKRAATGNLRQLARRLGLEDRVCWEYELGHDALQSWLQHAVATVAPLTECSRNLSQGCCPLKILESMAAGVPVVASELPVVRELVVDGVTGLLVQAERPSALALALRRVIELPELRARLGRDGRNHVAKHFTWSHTVDTTSAVYREMLAGSAPWETKTDPFS